MFVFTAKLNKKKLLAAAVVLLAAALLAVILLSILGAEGTSSPAVRSAEDAAAYLRSLGWQPEPEPIEVQELVIPRDFSRVYEQYAALQREQGFELERWAGMKATRYSFRLLNYPGGQDVVADLLVCGESVVAGDVQSTALDGFMEGLTAHAPGVSEARENT